jgi:hypothetical protein
MKITYNERKLYKSERNGKCPQYFYSTKNSKICEHAFCTKQPSFGPPGTRYLRCKDHIKPGDVNLRARKCGVDGCEITPAFGPPNTNKGFRCLKHKLDTDINVKAKHCEVKDCELTASFGPKGTRKMIRCFKHRHVDDINTKRNKIEGDDSDDNSEEEENTQPEQMRISNPKTRKMKVRISREERDVPVDEVCEDISD